MESYDIDAEIEQLENRLTELKRLKMLSQAPNRREIPKLGQIYFYYEGGLCKNVQWEGDNFDRLAFNIGNVFNTEDEATDAYLRWKTLTAMKEWTGKSFDRYAFKLNKDTKKLLVTFVNTLDESEGEIRFASEDDAKACREIVGADNIIKYYFGVNLDKEGE